VRAFPIREGRPWIYMHRKLAVIDDAVYFGSHNLNLPSTVAMDELSFEIESPKLAEVVRRLFDEDLAANGEPLDPAWVHGERQRFGGRVYRWFGWRFLGYM
jgi:phosphatidylserine/phosphatidylglycerophosphate/cardiolipin synthase-like enzyme